MHQADQAWRVFCYSCISTDCLVDRLSLGERRRGFSPSSSVSSSITHRRVILCLRSSSLLFYLSFYYCVIMIMGQSSLFVYLLALLYSALSLSQSKINRVVTLIWGSKQLLCFNTFSSFQFLLDEIIKICPYILCINTIEFTSFN